VYEQAMSDEHRAEWVKAMCQEVDSLASMDAWEEVHASTAVLVLSLILDWTTCSFDFTQTFLHNPIDEPNWIQIPQGFCSDMQGNFSLFKSMPLRKEFRRLLQPPSEVPSTGRLPHDPFLHFKKDMLFIVYVNNCGITCQGNEGH
jgi:hypothetical protein